jgi:hypothetical protein
MLLLDALVDTRITRVRGIGWQTKARVETDDQVAQKITTEVT